MVRVGKGRVGWVPTRRASLRPRLSARSPPVRRTRRSTPRRRRDPRAEEPGGGMRNGNSPRVLSVSYPRVLPTTTHAPLSRRGRGSTAMRCARCMRCTFGWGGGGRSGVEGVEAKWRLHDDQRSALAAQRGHGRKIRVLQIRLGSSRRRSGVRGGSPALRVLTTALPPSRRARGHCPCGAQDPCADDDARHHAHRRLGAHGGAQEPRAEEVPGEWRGAGGLQVRRPAASPWHKREVRRQACGGGRAQRV
ncbi:hypothetical protein DFH09DRAFT_1136990 [Mycena vulgaris]|nr:hypothetical protein DFH09DRAFT_1136990 [Mycena vulgaris]